MEKPVQTSATKLRKMKFMKDSSNLFANRNGNMEAMNVTAKTFIYTFDRYFLTERPIIPRNISRRAARQHCEMQTATISTVSGMQP